MPNGKALDRLHGLEKMRPTLKRKVMAHKLKTPKDAPECKEPCVPMGPSNLDLVVTPQGVVSGQSVYVATHYLRSYTDGFLEFNVNRDKPFTSGYALICVSGHLVTP